MSNYGEHVLSKVLNVKLNADNFGDSQTRIVKQWIDKDIGNIDISLPKGNFFSKDLIIETSSGDNSNYSGLARVEMREKDYSDPEKVIETHTITCRIVP